MFETPGLANRSDVAAEAAAFRPPATCIEPLAGERGVINREEFDSEVSADHANEELLLIKEICVLLFLVLLVILRSWVLQ